MKKAIKVIIVITILLALCAVGGMLVLRPVTISEFFNNLKIYRILQKFTEISYWLALLFTLLTLFMITMYAMIKLKCKRLVFNILIRIVVAILFVYLSGVTVYNGLYICDRYGFVRQEQLKKHHTMSEFAVELRDSIDDDECFNFAASTEFNWDKVYIFSYDFNQDELDSYVSGETYDEFQRAFKLVNRIEDREGQSVICFFKEEKLLMTFDIGTDIYMSEDADEVIYFAEFSNDDAWFKGEYIGELTKRKMIFYHIGAIN